MAVPISKRKIALKEKQTKIQTNTNKPNNTPTFVTTRSIYKPTQKYQQQTNQQSKLLNTTKAQSNNKQTTKQTFCFPTFETLHNTNQQLQKYQLKPTK